jgi:hypothetical protein
MDVLWHWDGQGIRLSFLKLNSKCSQSDASDLRENMQASSFSEGAIPLNQSSATRGKITNESVLMHNRPLFPNLKKWGPMHVLHGQLHRQASLFTAIAHDHAAIPAIPRAFEFNVNRRSTASFGTRCPFRSSIPTDPARFCSSVCIPLSVTT